MGRGDQKDFSCLPFFLLFVSPLVWSGTNSAASGANNAGFCVAAMTMLTKV